MATTRVCAFCQQTANLTGEHLFAEWVDKLLTKSTSHYVFTDIDPKDSSVRRFGGRHLDRTFKCVCKNCNNGWMSDIDNEARDVLKDVILYRARVSFLASGIRSIAKFTMKNALVADYMHHTPFFSERQRKQFKENRELLPGTHAWFGGVVTGRRKKTGLYKLSYGEPPSETRHGAKLCVFTWSAECLLLQLVAARWTNLLDLANGWPELAQDPRSNRIMCPFWPIPLERHATWPPQQNISQDHLERVADRFKFVRLS